MDFDDYSLIYLLSYQNTPNLLLILIQNNGNVNAVDKQHGSSLQLAARKGYTTIARHLIAAGADIEHPRSKCEPTVLFTALYEKRQDIAQLLLENGSYHDIVNDRDETPLIVAATLGCMAAVRKIIQLGVNMNTEGGRALQKAAAGRHWQIVQLLFHSGADVNFKSKNDRPALEAACRNGNYLMVKLLLESGAIVNNGSGDNRNPLSAAAVGGNVQIVQLLIQSGADVNIIGEGSDSALQVAAENGNKEMVQLLLDAGANVNYMGRRSGSALQVAAKNGNEKVVRLLLNAGADVNCMGGDSGSALQEAVKIRHLNISRLLRLHGAKDVEI